MQDIVRQQLQGLNGYLSDATDSFVLACFVSEAAAVRFALLVIHNCLHSVAWPQALLHNILCEEVRGRDGKREGAGARACDVVVGTVLSERRGGTGAAAGVHARVAAPVSALGFTPSLGHLVV